MVSWLTELRNRSMAVRAMALTVVVLAVFAVVGPVAVQLGGSTALVAATVAAFLCLAGAGTALVASGLLRGPGLALAALMVGMAARMSIPLAFGVGIHLRGGPLAEAGLLYYLLVFYTVTLAVETLLSLPVPQRSQGSPETVRT